MGIGEISFFYFHNYYFLRIFAAENNYLIT